MLIDALILFIVLAACVSGWRRGAFSAVLSALGIVAGLTLAVVGLPPLIERADAQLVRVAVLIVAVVLVVCLGSFAGSTVGDWMHDRFRRKSAQRVDSLFGALFQGAVAVVLVWCVCMPLAASLPGESAKYLQSSRVLTKIDAAMPAAGKQLPAQVAAVLADSGLPPLISPFASDGHAEVDAPDPSVARPELVDAARASVVHVMGDAESCSRRLMGSGFVIEDGYVLTNAHVVAGTETVSLDTVLGVKKAKVVLYDSDADIAVLRAEALGIAPLRWAEGTLRTGDSALVMGFPESGPFEAMPVRVRSQVSLSGPDIYAKRHVQRQVYTIRGNIRQGNSGGPMLTSSGAVAGMVFGASVDATETGYVLTAHQILERTGEITGLREQVGTGACVGR